MMAEITAKALREAADLLGIHDQASLNEIRTRYHNEIKQWHPDVSKNEPAASHEMTIRLHAAYTLLSDYCMNHPVSFRPEDLAKDLERNPIDYWMERFGDDPIWG